MGQNKLLKNMNMYLAKMNTLSNLFDKFFDELNQPVLDKLTWNEHFFSKTEKGYVLELLLPGLNKDNLKVSIEDSILSIVGEFKSERNSYQVNRSYKLMEDIDTSNIVADIKDGVLKITLPFQQEKKKTKKIELI